MANLIISYDQLSFIVKTIKDNKYLKLKSNTCLLFS